jgi:hypothetical protein
VQAFGRSIDPPIRKGPGRPQILPWLEVSAELTYATESNNGKGTESSLWGGKLVFGTQQGLERALRRFRASSQVNTSFVERQNGTDRCRNARKARKTYRFSKGWESHESMTYFTLYSYNFCWSVRTLRVKKEEGGWQPRSPAMAANLTDHVWKWDEWFSVPAAQSP